jgi:transposase-like protein
LSVKRRKFSDEFKRKVLSEVAAGSSAAEVTRRYGLAKNSIYDWQVAAARQTTTVAIPQHELSDLHEKVADLERLVGHLTLENDLLKKLERLQKQKEDEIS